MLLFHTLCLLILQQELNPIRFIYMFTLKMIQKRMLIECCLRIAQFYQKFNITEEKNPPKFACSILNIH